MIPQPVTATRRTARRRTGAVSSISPVRESRPLSRTWWPRRGVQGDDTGPRWDRPRMSLPAAGRTVFVSRPHDAKSTTSPGAASPVSGHQTCLDLKARRTDAPNVRHFADLVFFAPKIENGRMLIGASAHVPHREFLTLDTLLVYGIRWTLETNSNSNS